MGTLILASREDSASMNLLSAVISLGGWGDSKEMVHGQVTKHSSGVAEVLLIDDLHIWADGIDIKHEELTDFEVDEVLVLSRHVSASETPALTLHAIGVPGEFPHGKIARSGGVSGTAVPPSPRFGGLFRTMREIAIDSNLDEDYDITLEATHHGPVLERPTLYIEIGSTQKQWEDQRASNVWAEAISRSLGFSGGSSDCWTGSGRVMVGLGGGHYAPRHKAIICENEVWVGHILANYAILFDEKDGRENPQGPWIHSVKTAVESTRIAFPGGDVFAHLDRKSFKSWQRRAIESLLSNLGVPVLRGKQISLP
tara:strand:+ start:795 stop:1730 length:936 start_codon:yes stop_codon:yes gene_type:complete